MTKQSQESAWYLIYTKPNMEILAQENLARQDYTSYLPKIKNQRRKNRRYRTVIDPMFPRYLFVFLNNGIDDWRPIRSTIGVNHIVRFGEDAIPVPQALIDTLRQRENPQGLQQIETTHLKVGDRVKIRDGVAQDIEGIITAECGKDRVRLLIELMNNEATLTVPRQNIVASMNRRTY